MYILSILAIFLYFLFYRFYYKPKAEIARYKQLFNDLGYTCYESPFVFLGISFLNDWNKGILLHKEAQYYQRTLFPHFDIAIGNILDKIGIFLVKPNLIKEFLSIDSIHKYPKYKKIVEAMMLTTGIGITFSQGQLWKNKRKLMSKVFNFDLVKNNTKKIHQICKRCYNGYEKTYKIGERKYKYDPLDVSSKIFNGVMMKCFFGSDLIDEEINGRKLEQFVIQISTLSAQVSMNPTMGIFGKFAWDLGLTSKIRNLKNNVYLLRQKARQILKKRTQEVLKYSNPEQNIDIISALIQQKMQNKEAFSYSDQDFIAEFQTFLIAGTDTTARFYTMLVYYLGKYPQIQEKVRRQIDKFIKSDQDFTYQNLKNLKYFECLQHQTIRYYGPANGILFRQATDDNFISDIPIFKGTAVSIQPRGNHFNPKCFKDPQTFRPQRWQRECDGIDPYAFMGFGAGARGCIGKHLAYLESKIAIVQLLRRYKTFQVPKELAMIYSLIFEAEKFDVTFAQ